ncbi:MAG: hypothetical protein Q9191_001238 [Dirinaria sp. TL-2023a]
MAKSTAPVLSEKAGVPGAAVYSRVLLVFYDFFILKIMSSIFWRCSTARVTLPFFRSHIRRNHLDIGVGTGWFLQNSHPASDASITLCDLNANCLEKTKERLGRPDLDVLQHDILEPLPESLGTFDSISIMYLLHCLPPPQERKCQVFSMLKHHLKPDGVLFGCTVLGPKSGNQTSWSKWALRRINRKGRMGNLEDTEEMFVEVLNKNYSHVESQVVGSMLVFSARQPIW